MIFRQKMALKLPADEVPDVAFQSIGCGYDISLDLKLKYCKGADFGTNPYRMCRLIEMNEDEGRDIMLSGGVLITNVPESIKCDKGEHTRFQTGPLSFQQMSEQFNRQLSLDGKIPSGLFNAMFKFSGNWQKDASITKTLAFDGVFISLYNIALEKSRILLCDYVKSDVPSSWDPPLLARFIEKYGTHIIVGVKMGGKNVICIKQDHLSSVEPADVEELLKKLADRKFLDSDEQSIIDSGHIPQNDIEMLKGVVNILTRRGGSSDGNLKHSEWLRSIQLKPDVISMSFVPITSLLNGVLGSGYLSHAINLYLCYKPPIEELREFLEFQLPRQWAPVFSHLPIGPQRELQNTFSFSGPELHVNTNLFDVGKRPVTGLRLYLEGKKSNRLAIHLQHLSSLPKILQFEDSVAGIGIFNLHPEDRAYYEKFQWKHFSHVSVPKKKHFSHVCMAPVESEDEHSIVTGAQLHVKNSGVNKVLFLRFRFSKLLNGRIRRSEWDSTLGLDSGEYEEVNINSGIYHGVQRAPIEATELLEYVDTMELTRGPQDRPGYWVVSGGLLRVEKGKISLRVKYSLLTLLDPDDEQMTDWSI